MEQPEGYIYEKSPRDFKKVCHLPKAIGASMEQHLINICLTGSSKFEAYQVRLVAWKKIIAHMAYLVEVENPGTTEGLSEGILLYIMYDG